MKKCWEEVPVVEAFSSEKCYFPKTLLLLYAILKMLPYYKVTNDRLLNSMKSKELRHLPLGTIVPQTFYSFVLFRILGSER